MRGDERARVLKDHALELRRFQDSVRGEKYSLNELRLKLPMTIMKLYKIRVITTPTIEKGGFMPSFKVFCKFTEFYNSLDHQTPKFICDRPHSDHIPIFNDPEEKKQAEEADKKKRSAKKKKGKKK